MVTVSLSTAILGGYTRTSLHFTGLAVIFGVLSVAVGWLLSVVGLPGAFEMVVYGTIGIACVLAAVHTYENNGLLVSWILVFWPTAGAAAYIGYVSEVDGPRGKQYLFSDVVMAGVYGGAITAIFGGTVVFALTVLVKWLRTR